MINSPDSDAQQDNAPEVSPRSGGETDLANAEPGMAKPRCRCTPEEIADGHRHRCPAGPLNYVAVGDWADMTPEEIEARLRDDAGPGERGRSPFGPPPR